jgi:hypothetical protein
MIRGAKYKHIEPDSQVAGIGTMFRGVGIQQWFINLDLVRKKSSKINFSAVPILARRRFLNSSGPAKKSGKVINITIENAQSWEKALLNEYPAVQKLPNLTDGSQHCFVAEQEGMKVYIPQLELARVLFYHDPFMTRTSLRHNALAENFQVDLTADDPKVYVIEGADYPLYYFNRDTNRRFLSWVLIDKDARESFESIGSNLFTQKNRRGSYDLWDFQFTPPPLSGVDLELSGWHDFETNSFFVWEIQSVKKLPSSVTGVVDIIHPIYERRVGGKPISGNGSSAEPPDEYELDDDELSDIDKTTMSLMSESVTISFKNPFITNRLGKKMKPVKSVTSDGEKEVLDKELSANEQDETGRLPGGAWNNLNDQTDDTHLYLSKFKSFLEMTNLLVSTHGCKLKRQTLEKLPKYGHGKKHWLTDTQNPRLLAIVELTYDGQPITLLEVDTSDGAAKLSTMMLKTAEDGWVMKNIEAIKLGIMKKSLGWPTTLFKEALTEEGCSGVAHPKSKHSGGLPPEEIAPWAQRFINWMAA